MFTSLLVIDVILLLLLLLLKHYVVDFMLQTPFQYKNKGTLGHPGGILHAGLHGAASFLILSLFTFSITLPVCLGVVESVLHYFIDYAKIKIQKAKNWLPTTSDYYFWLLGFDQLLHQLTYIAMCLFMI